MTLNILIFLFIFLLPFGIFYPAFRRNLKNNRSTDERFRFILIFLTKIYLFALAETCLLAVLVFHGGIKKLEILHGVAYAMLTGMGLLMLPFAVGWMIYFFQKILMKE